MKMKKIVSVMLVCLLMTLSMGAMNGCTGTAETGKTAVCYVVGSTANSQGLNLSSPMVQDMAYDVILGYGYISVVSVDGEPEVVMATDYDIDEQRKKASPARLKKDARINTTSLITTMQGIVANDPEADYLEALRLAARSLSSLEGYDSKEIVVIGTGLSTTGLVDFRNNILSAEPEAVVDILAQREAIPDFKGISVVWQQLGDVAAPQKKLTQSQQNRLQQIWGGIVERGGGEFFYNAMIAAPVNEDVSYPAISVVELPGDAPITFDMQSVSAVTFQSPVMLSEKQVCFVSNSAEFISPNEAVETIRPIAQYMLSDSSMTLLLVGCIAGDTSTAEGYSLSLRRAETVKNTLVAMGVPADKLITKGMACSDPWHIEGAGYEGALAAQNRKVVLLDASTQLAGQIMAA